MPASQASPVITSSIRPLDCEASLHDHQSNQSSYSSLCRPQGGKPGLGEVILRFEGQKTFPFVYPLPFTTRAKESSPAYSLLAPQFLLPKPYQHISRSCISSLLFVLVLTNSADRQTWSTSICLRSLLLQLLAYVSSIPYLSFTFEFNCN